MPSPEPPDLLALFVAPLNRLGLTYMVTGSVAAGIYGAPRMTNDIDLVLALSDDNSGPFHEAFDQTAFYVAPLEVIREERLRPRHGHFNIIHHASAYKADIFLAGDDPLHAWGLEHRHELMVEHQPVWIAPPEYVIIRKLQYFRDGGSTKHLTDIANVLTVLGSDLDLDTVTDQVDHLGLRDEWIQARAAKSAPDDTPPAPA